MLWKAGSGCFSLLHTETLAESMFLVFDESSGSRSDSVVYVVVIDSLISWHFRRARWWVGQSDNLPQPSHFRGLVLFLFDPAVLQHRFSLVRHILFG